MGELVKITGVADFIRASKAKNTQAAYASDLRHFGAWCAAQPQYLGHFHGNESIPAEPETVATYLAALAGTHYKFATIRRRAAALAFAHRAIGAYNPLDHQGVKDTLAGIARTFGRAPVKKAALTAELLARAVRKIPVERRANRSKIAENYANPMRRTGSDPGLEPGLCGGGAPIEPQPTKNSSQIAAGNAANSVSFSPGAKLEPNLTGLRDRALLLLGFAGALRRSELVDLNVNDVTRHSQGALIIVRRGKTDQTGQGLSKAVPHGKRLRAIEALDAWLSAAAITEGPIFRAVHGTVVLGTRLTAGQVARIIKKRAAAIGLDPALFSGHSLRSGFITSAAEAGASLSKIADQAGHSKLDTTRGYVQVADAFRDHSGRKFL